jgi:hypothetical protein
MRKVAIIVIGKLIGGALLAAVTILVDQQCNANSLSFSFGGWLIGGYPKNTVA